MNKADDANIINADRARRGLPHEGPALDFTSIHMALFRAARCAGYLYVLGNASYATIHGDRVAWAGRS